MSVSSQIPPVEAVSFTSLSPPIPGVSLRLVNVQRRYTALKANQDKNTRDAHTTIKSLAEQRIAV